MAQRAGELIHRVQIQKFEKTRNEYGHFDETWVDHVKLWARVTHLSGRDLISAQAMQSETIARLKIRYRDNIDSTMRVVYKNRIYAINSPALEDADNGNIYVTFTLSNGVGKYQE